MSTQLLESPFERRALVSSINETARTFEVIFATTTPVARVDWMSGQRFSEVLSFEAAHCDISRLDSGRAPFLDTHDFSSIDRVLGAVEPGSVRLSKTDGRARVRFSSRPRADEVWNDIRAGLTTAVSCGYRVLKYGLERKLADGSLERTAVAWQPLEVSIVGIPADPAAHIRAASHLTSEPVAAVTTADADRGRRLALARAAAGVTPQPSGPTAAQQELVRRTVERFIALGLGTRKQLAAVDLEWDSDWLLPGSAATYHRGKHAIALRTGLDDDALVLAVAHEAMHACDIRRLVVAQLSIEEFETRAEAASIRVAPQAWQRLRGRAFLHQEFLL